MRARLSWGAPPWQDCKIRPRECCGFKLQKPVKSLSLCKVTGVKKWGKRLPYIALLRARFWVSDLAWNRPTHCSGNYAAFPKPVSTTAQSKTSITDRTPATPYVRVTQAANWTMQAFSGTDNIYEARLRRKFTYISQLPLFLIFFIVLARMS